MKRNTLRLLQFTDVPKQGQGELIDLCFSALDNPREAVAIKVFATAAPVSGLPEPGT